MSTKKDPEVRENIDRGPEEDQGSAGIDSRNNNYKDDDGANPKTVIKNANAAGIGAIGRDDQKLTNYQSNRSADAGNESGTK